MEKIPADSQNIPEQFPDGAFSNLPPRVTELLQEMLDGKIDLNLFLKSLEGVPGRDNFYKRLRTGSRVKVLRESGGVDVQGWIIDPGPKKGELENDVSIRVHNKQKHLAKIVPLIDLIKWNI